MTSIEDLDHLPGYYRFTLQRLPLAEARNTFGPFGDGETHEGTKRPADEDFPLWNCTITLVQTCDTCQQPEPLAYFKGFGVSIEQAFAGAITQLGRLLKAHPELWKGLIP
jgi:hypothetical protein